MVKTLEKLDDALGSRTAALAALAVIVIVALAIAGLIARNWLLFEPAGNADRWAAIDTIADAVTALCTVGIAAFGLRGLRSLAIARDEIIHRAKREAKLCAIGRLEEVAKEIIPLNTAALDAMATTGVGVFLGPSDKVQFDPDPTDLRDARAWIKGLPPTAYNRIVTFLNRLEAWSVYFTTGVADPDVAYGPIAPLLRSWVGQYYAMLLELRSGAGSASGRFPNIVQLYTVWSAKIDAQQLDRMHKDIAGQMEHAKLRMEASKLPDVVPRLGP